MKLSVRGLNSYYGPAHILFDVALEVGDGEVVALLGRNGAGKSTTFRSIVGLVERREGQIIFEGQDVSKQPTHAIVRNGLGYVPEERRIFTDLTVEENLEVGRQPPRSNAPQWTREKLFTLFPNLGEMRGRMGGRLTAMDVATIKGVIDRLTARGLTETSPDPQDGRRLLVSLTRAGQSMAEKAAPQALAISKETLAPLDAKERETFVALLSKLR